ncbi:MAG: glycosyltransferase [Fimbriimonadaceae bacterium]
MPRVSILLTCYNHLAYLREAWADIQAQTFQDYEVIAIDDGSSDGTREWLAEIADRATVILNERNLGTYGSLNRALESATGEFVAVLNDDDRWAPEKLARQMAAFDSFPEIGLVHTGGRFIDGEGRVLEGNPLGFAWPTFPVGGGGIWVGDARLALVYENKIIASAAVARRECFEKLGGFNPEYFGSGDWEMWFRIAEVWPIGFVAEPLTDYRVHGANASHKLERIWRDDVRLRSWLAPRLDSLEDRFPAAEVRRAKAHNWAALGTVRTLTGDPREGRRAYAESLRLYPGRLKSVLRYGATFLPRPLFRKLL